MTMLRSLHQLSFQTDLNSILLGDSMLTDEQNDILFSIIQTFIKQTKRFSLSQHLVHYFSHVKPHPLCK